MTPTAPTMAEGSSAATSSSTCGRRTGWGTHVRECASRTQCSSSGGRSGTGCSPISMGSCGRKTTRGSATKRCYARFSPARATPPRDFPRAWAISRPSTWPLRAERRRGWRCSTWRGTSSKTSSRMDRSPMASSAASCARRGTTTPCSTRRGGLLSSPSRGSSSSPSCGSETTPQTSSAWGARGRSRSAWRYPTISRSGAAPSATASRCT
mmetsp:Transcript_1505/g.5874  ORF Transcript_1505/g.5874 Transcript_1505/m.5874 type:complete len:210 (-) Transcript_1505:199-828(-)